MIITLQGFLYLALMLVAFAVEAWALIDVLRRPAAAFPWAGKRTKGFWTAVVAAAAAVGFIAIPPPIGAGLLGGFSIISLVGVVAAAVYLVDVRPAVAGYRPGPSSRGW